jgi:hypothetical protein
MAKLLIKWFQVAILASSLVMASSSWAEDNASVDTATERPGYFTIMGDILFARPLTLVATAVGSVLFVVTLPVTLVTGTVGEAGMSMVGDPALNTFVRCLGCKEVGWRKLPPKEADDPMDKH